MTEGEKQIRLEHRQLQEKRIYFLLAAAGACIGFSVTQMDDLNASSSLYLLIASLALCGLSFVAGLKTVSKEEKLLETNSAYLDSVKLLSGDPNKEDQFKKLVSDEAFDPIGRAKLFWSNVQMSSLFMGGILLPIWKLAECNGCIDVLLNWQQ